MRIAHVPNDHPYVRSVDPTSIPVDDPLSVTDLLDADVDVVHVHFGFEHLAPAEMSSWIDDVRRCGLALVHTVHDIDNPHLVDQRDHHARTAELVRRSDVVTTLTDQAAHEVHREWGRRPAVVAHPPILTERPPNGPGEAVSENASVLVWMSTLRPNLDLVAIGRLVEDTTSELDLVVRRESWASASHELRLVVSTMASRPNVQLSLVDRLADDELARRIAASSVLVLAYSWGTHSGLVELATDVGSPAVTTPNGAREDQGAFVASSMRLATTVDELVAAPPIVRRSIEAELDTVRAEHRRWYEVACRRAARCTARAL